MRPAALAFVVVSVFVVGATAYVAFQQDPSVTLGFLRTSDEPHRLLVFWLLAGGATVVLAAIAAAWARREELLREWMTPRWGDATRGVAGAIALFGLAWAFVRLVAPFQSKRSIWLVTLYGQIGDPNVLQTYAPAVAAAVIASAAAEEVLWRGMVTQLLADRVGSRTAWVWAAGLYAIAYVPTMWSLRADLGLDPVLPIAALGGGLLWGAMARYFGRLVPGIVAHALFDWTVVMMFRLWGPNG